MTTIDIGLPISVARMILQRVQGMVPPDSLIIRRVQQKEQEPHSTIEVEIPDMTATHQISVMKDRDRMMASGYYESPAGVLPPMRRDVADLGLADQDGLFTPLCFVPLVIIYNHGIDNPPGSWLDLCNPRWKGRISVPSPDILQKLMKFYATDLLGSKAEVLFSHVSADGLPVDVNQKVDDGSADIGIVSLPFSRSSRKGNISLCWPEEGALLLPEVLIHKKGAGEDVLKVSEYLLSLDVQRYFSDVGVMIPVHPDAPMPSEALEHSMNFYWKGWDWFIAGINEVNRETSP